MAAQVRTLRRLPRARQYFQAAFRLAREFGRDYLLMGGFAMAVADVLSGAIPESTHRTQLR
jgi:hypothetical protein